MEGIRIVRGNDFYLMIPIRKIVFSYDNNGKEVRTGQRINLCDCLDLSVRVFWCTEECSKPTTFYISEHDESQLIVKVCGKILPLGWYGIEVTGTIDGCHIRSFERKVFKIVKSNGDSNVSTSMYNGEVSYPIDAMWTLYNSPSDKEIKRTDVKSIGVNGETYNPDKEGFVKLPNYPSTDGFVKSVRVNGNSIPANKNSEVELPDYPEIPSGIVKSVSMYGRKFTPNEEGDVKLPAPQGDGEGGTPIVGDDAASVCGYKICVLFPAQFDRESAQADTIYFIIKQGENIISIPETIERTYQLGGGGYTPTPDTGWNFDETPTECDNRGVYEFPISLVSDDLFWADGTKTGKVLRVEIKPYIINVPASVSVQATGNDIPVNRLVSLPNEATCSYEVIEGGNNLHEAGTYRVRLTLTNPNYEFSTGETAEMLVYVTASSTPSAGWVFGNGFPIVFGEGQSQQPSVWVFGNGFPIVFGEGQSQQPTPETQEWTFSDGFPIIFSNN